MENVSHGKDWGIVQSLGTIPRSSPLPLKSPTSGLFFWENDAL